MAILPSLSLSLSELLSALNLLSQATRILKLHVPRSAPLAVQRLVLYQIAGEESVCDGVSYRLQCLSDDQTLPLKDLQGLPLAFSIRTDLGVERMVCGVVTRAESLLSTGAASAFELRIQDALAVLDLRNTRRVFSDKSVIEITEIILSEHTRSNSVLAACFKFSTDGLKRSYPQRAFTQQADETDTHFLTRLWRQEGIAWYFSFALDGDNAVQTLHLADHEDAYAENPAGIVRFHRADITESRDAVVAWHGWREQSVSGVARASFDYKSVKAVSTDSPTLLKQGDSGDALASTLADYQYDPAKFSADASHYDQMGESRIKAHEFAAKGFRGESTVRLFGAGTVFTLIEHAEIDTHAQDERRFTLTRLVVQAHNGVPIHESCASLLNAKWPRLSGSNNADDTPVYYNHFECVRSHVAIVPSFDPASVPRVGLTSAIVVGDGGKEIDVDEMGRIAVMFPFAREAEHPSTGVSKSTKDSARIRVMQPWADAGYGTAFWPRVGSEIMIGFVDNHPDKPIALGGVYDGTHGVPMFNGKGALPNNAPLYGIRSKEIKGDRHNQLRLDDTSAQISTQLLSEHAATQLNQGWLGTPRTDGKSEARGEGFELATDAAGALRSAKGLLISAFGRLNASGNQLAREETLDLMEECLNLFKQLGKYAAQHQGQDFDSAPQSKAQSQLKNWENGSNTAPKGSDGGTPLIAMTAPEGLLFSTPKCIMQHAAQNVDMVALKHLQFASTERTTFNAGKGYSVFAQSEGIKLIANQGKILMQSQNDDTVINASKNVRISASDAKIEMLAMKELYLVESGGAYIKLAGGAIELGCPGNFTVKAAGHNWGGATSGTADLPKFELGSVGRTPVVVRATDGESIASAAYQIVRSDGSVLNGTTDAEGKGEKLSNTSFETALFKLLP